MKERVVSPEILDELPREDARARRSRRDLRLINALMGNERWIRRELARLSPKGEVAELGAGNGELLECLARDGLEGRGYDLQGRPDGLSDKVSWSEGDLFENLPQHSPRVVVGSLILHHFQDEALARLGHLLVDCDALVFAEPWRSRLALAEGALLFPLVNGVTRHDMMVSIRAGFRKGELAARLDLGPNWRWRERVTPTGGLRSVAVRK